MKLTDEQKNYCRESSRVNQAVGLTWQLFMQFLSEGKSPVDALQLARDAMQVWQDFDDANWMEPLVVEHPDLSAQVQDLVTKWQPMIQPLLQSILASKQPVYPPAPFLVVPKPAAPSSVPPDRNSTAQAKEDDVRAPKEVKP